MALSNRGTVAAAGPDGAERPARLAPGNLTTAAGSGLPLPRSELIAAGKSIVRCMRRVTDKADPAKYSATETTQLMGDAARIGALASILAPAFGLVSLAGSGAAGSAGASGDGADSPAEIVERLRRHFGQLGYMQGVLDENISQLDGQLDGLDGKPEGKPEGKAEAKASGKALEITADFSALSADGLRKARASWAARADADVDALIRAQEEMNDLDDLRRNLDHQLDAVSELLARLDDAGTTPVPPHVGDTLCYGLGWHLAGDQSRMSQALRENRARVRVASRVASAGAAAATGGAGAGGAGAGAPSAAVGAGPAVSAKPAPAPTAGPPFAEWAAANKIEGGRLAILQAIAGLERWCGFYDALTGTLQRQLVQLRSQADTDSAARRGLAAEMQRRSLEPTEEAASRG